jgi:hypothetical protein
MNEIQNNNLYSLLQMMQDRHDLPRRDKLTLFNMIAQFILEMINVS